MKKWFTPVMGVCIGFLNGLFGAGGGIVAVPVLKKLGLKQKQAQATAISITLPLSLAAIAFYAWRGTFAIQQGLLFIPGGIVGAILGSLLFKKLSNVWLRRIFAAFVIFSAVRLLLQ